MHIPCDVLIVLNYVMFLCFQYGFVAWLLSTSVGLSLSFLRYYDFFIFIGQLPTFRTMVTGLCHSLDSYQLFSLGHFYVLITNIMHASILQ